MKSISQMMGGNIFLTLSSFISGYAYALLLGPSLYGIWQTARVVFDYTGIFSLSLPFVMRRDFVMLRGEGKFEEANRIAHQVFSYVLITTPIFAVSVLGYAFLFTEEVYFKHSLIIISIILIVNIISGFGNIISKGVNDYKTLLWASIIMGIGSLVPILFIPYFGYYSIIIGFLITNIAVSIYYYIKKPISYKWFWDNKLLKTLVVAALPLYLTDISASLFTSIDRVIIASFLSFKDVGLYSLSSLISTPLNLVAGSIGIVLFTQLNEKFGKSKEPDVILKHSNIPQEILSYLLPPFIGAGIILLPLLTKIFLPKYNEGILTAQISVFGAFFYMQATFSSNALFVLEKQKISSIYFLFTGIIKTLGSFLFLYLGLGISGVAIATVIAYLFYDFALMFSVYKYCNIPYKLFYKDTAKKLYPVLYAAAISIVTLLILMNANYQTMLAKNLSYSASSIIFMLFCIPLFLTFRKKIKPYFNK